MTWVRRLERISRPHRPRALVAGRVQNLFNNLAFILAALLLQAPLRFVPFSTPLPPLPLLFLAGGLIQRDRVAVLRGSLATVGTIIHFGILSGGGGVAARQLWP